MTQIIKLKANGTTTVTMTTANTEYSATLPRGCRNLTMSLADSAVTWRLSWTTGIVATGGHPIGSGSVAREFESDALLAATVIYFASSTASQTMVLSYFVEESG